MTQPTTTANELRPATATGANLYVIDDPIKGRKYAESPVVRASTLDWLKADFLTRLSPTAIVVLIQTRWHTNDPAGWVLEQSQKNTEDDVEGNALGNSCKWIDTRAQKVENNQEERR